MTPATTDIDLLIRPESLQAAAEEARSLGYVFEAQPEAVTDRLREMSRLSDLRTVHRLATKVDMSPEAVTRRLRRQSELRRACLRWIDLGRSGEIRA